MADASPMSEGAQLAEPQVEFRPCPFCGASIHPSSHLCPECGGHVAISWGTVHKELYLFLLCSILIAVGCLASWTGRMPVKANGVWTTLATTVGPAMNGLDTHRGTLMFAVALYGIVAGFMNILYRRMVVWPYLLNSLLALWVGIGGLTSVMGSDAWNAWGEQFKVTGGTMTEKFFGGFRAVPPGFLLLTLAGFMIMARLLGGIVAAATKPKEAAPSADEGRLARRKARESAKGDGAATDEATASATGGAEDPKP